LGSAVNAPGGVWGGTPVEIEADASWLSNVTSNGWLGSRVVSVESGTEGPGFKSATYIVIVVVSKKWCEIDMLLLHTTDRKYHMAYLFVPFPLTFV